MPLLPDAANALIPIEKLRDYVLEAANPQNRGKARLFEALGYRRSNWQQLANDLRSQHLTREATLSRSLTAGTAYEIVAELRGPAGSANIKSIWWIDAGGDTPRFITAYGA